MTSYEPGEPMLTMGEEVEEVDEGAAWTKKSGKNPEGGLNEKGVSLMKERTLVLI